MNLICKWGCDGSSDQSLYKQKFSDDDGSKSDANIFFTLIVPLQLISVDQAINAEIIVRKYTKGIPFTIRAYRRSTKTWIW